MWNAYLKTHWNLGEHDCTLIAPLGADEEAEAKQEGEEGLVIQALQ